MSCSRVSIGISVSNVGQERPAKEHIKRHQQALEQEQERWLVSRDGEGNS